MMERSWDDLVKYNAVEMTLGVLLHKAQGEGNVENTIALLMSQKDSQGCSRMR